MVKKALGWFSEIENHEVKATALSFLFAFILMLSYYILRPVRDAMASDWSDAEVSQLWTMNFFISAAVVAIYGVIVSKVRFQRLVPGVYAFFAMSFILFYLSMWTISDAVIIDKAFYVWLSVFAMFHLSVFWSFMSDLFNKDQARRLFATIAAGASAGALIGPMIPTFLAGVSGIDNLILTASIILLLPIPLAIKLTRIKKSELHNDDQVIDSGKFILGGNPFAGFKTFVTDPYLLAIGAFILLYTMISSFVYFEQKNLLAAYDRATRTQILGSIDWIVNVLTFGIAFFATSRIVKKLGMGLTLALLPLIMSVAVLLLAFAPIVVILLVVQVLRRSGNYAVTRPAREMLFTEVSKEKRFKTKPVIDVVVYRGGDSLTAWIFTGLTEGIGLGLAAVGVIGAGIAAVWACVGLYLGGKYNNIQEEIDPKGENIEPIRQSV
ncbi:NTP/NDP exchange transporter [Reichenbachiella versicolor]|uniref:NTP/NDP exchange transporter n=1 Tax=Reichenbachiella versicolor TaxID=1821036 RepID=UPI000D6E2E81|nr:MFS transporter [Reichenbachiella versicolor]